MAELKNTIVNGVLNVNGDLIASTIKKRNGTSAQFLKADGSIDTNTYLTSASLNGYATQNWVTDKGYLTSNSLSGYATETWVTNKGYTTNTGTVTSVGLSAPTGFSVSNSPVTGSGTLTLSFAEGYSLPTTAKQANWDTAHGWGNHASAGYLTNGKGDLAFASDTYWSSFSIGKVSKNGILTLYKNNTFMDIKIDGTLQSHAELKIPVSGGTIATQGWVSTNYLPLTAGYDKQLTGILYANKPIGIRGTFDNNVVPTDVQGVTYLAYNSSSKSLDFIFN